MDECKEETRREERQVGLTVDGRPVPRHWLVPVALMWLGFAITCFATMAANYAAVWYVTESTGSPVALAAVYVCAFLPLGLLAPFGGVAADRFNRRAIIIACDLVVAAVALALALVISNGQVSLPVILIMAALCSTAQAFRSPAFNACMPLLVPERHLLRINALDNVVSSVSMICAPALGIFLYSTLGFASVMVVDAVGALAAAAAMLCAKVPSLPARQGGDGVLASMRQGTRALRENGGLLALVCLMTLGMMAYGPLDSLLPLMVSSQFGGDGYAASLVTAVFGIGMLAGSLALMAIGGKNRLTRIIVVAAFAVGAVTCAAGLLPSGAFACFVVLVGVIAFACAGFSSPTMTLMQEHVPQEKLGRVMGLFSAMMGLAIPLGTALGGTLAQGVGTPLFFVLDGLVIMGLAAAIALSPRIRSLDAAGSASQQENPC